MAAQWRRRLSSCQPPNLDGPQSSPPCFLRWSYSVRLHYRSRTTAPASSALPPKQRLLLPWLRRGTRRSCTAPTRRTVVSREHVSRAVATVTPVIKRSSRIHSPAHYVDLPFISIVCVAAQLGPAQPALHSQSSQRRKTVACAGQTRHHGEALSSRSVRRYVRSCLPMSLCADVEPGKFVLATDRHLACAVGWHLPHVL